MLVLLRAGASLRSLTSSVQRLMLRLPLPLLAALLLLAPPLLSQTGADGRPVKRRYGPWMMPVFGMLARLRWLRGTALDPFGPVVAENVRSAAKLFG